MGVLDAALAGRAVVVDVVSEAAEGVGAKVTGGGGLGSGTEETVCTSVLGVGEGS